MTSKNGVTSYLPKLWDGDCRPEFETWLPRYVRDGRTDGRSLEIHSATRFVVSLCGRTAGPSALKDLRPLHERILQVTLERVILQSVTGGDARVQLIQLSVVTVIMLRCPRMLES